MNDGYGTGMTNRYTSGVFASVNIEEHADGTYGDVCLEIDLQSFRQKLGKPLDIEPEPDVLEASIDTTFASHLGIDHEPYVTDDMSEYTVIIGHTIPLAFVKRVN